MLKRAEIPIVETWETPARPLGHVVSFSNKQAGHAMARYLHARGRRGLAFTGNSADRDRPGFERPTSYLEAVAELGLDARLLPVGAPPVSMAHGAEALERVIAQWPDTDAIVCVSDLLAFGSVAECQRRGVKVPRDIGLIGFGDFEVGRNYCLRPTTIGVDCAAIGGTAAEIVVSAIAASDDGRSFERLRSLVKFDVIERETA
jgi:LacI family gluconate utilization system Gnt-I transcriptional repressor